ncbi:SMI1/KNR4 family protein [Spirillospora sp. CA-253888]
MPPTDLDDFQRAWERFDAWLAAHSPAGRAELLRPATAEQITAVESAYQVSLHPHLAALLRLHNGTSDLRASFDPGRVLPGRHRLGGCKEIVGFREILVDLSEDWAEAFRDWDEDATEPVEAHLDHWVPFAFSVDGGMVFVDHHPGATYGQVYEAGLGAGGTPEYWAADLADFFERITRALETDTAFLYYTPAMCDGRPDDGGPAVRLLDW